MARFLIGRILPIFQGTWQSGQSYDKLDIVLVGQVSYASLVDNNTTMPSASNTSWQVVCRGATAAEVVQALEGEQLQLGRLDVIDDITASEILASVSLKIGGKDVATQEYVDNAIQYGIDEVSIDQTYSDKVNIETTMLGGGGSTQSISAATSTRAGVMSATDKAKLDSLSPIADHPVEVESDGNGDLDVSDEAGYVIGRFENGHIRTKNFYSGNVYTKSEVDSLIGSGSSQGVTQQQLQAGLATKQDKLTSGTNIKTINNTSLLGSGNIITTPQYIRWNGKKVGAFGDSITEGYNTTKNYLQYLQEDLGCTTYNYGLGGSRVVEISGDTVASFVDRCSTIRTDLDLLLVFGGINDFYFSECELGSQYTINSSTKKFTLNTDTTTFYGAYNVIMQTLITRLPTAQIYLLTPIHAGAFSTGTKSTWMQNGKGLTIMDFSEAIKKVGQLWGVPVIDMLSVSGMNPNVTASQQAYFNHTVPSSTNPDYLHPDANGHRRIADTILKYI